MAERGKHEAQNNPHANGKRLIGAKRLIILLVATASVASFAAKKDEEKHTTNEVSNTPDNEITLLQEAEHYSLEELYNSIKSNYSIYQSEGILNTYGNILQYFDTIINNPDLTEKDKIEMLEQLINSDDIYAIINQYIEENCSRGYGYEHISTDPDNLEAITNDSELMGKINEASLAYHVPESVLIGLIARNYNGVIEPSVISGAYGSNWNNLDSARSAHNYITGENDQLKEWKSGNSVMHLAAILANSIKEQNADIYKAIEMTLAGPEKMRRIEKEADEQKRQELQREVNEVLSYASAYLKDERITLIYSSVSETQMYKLTFESSMYYNYLVDKINTITNDLKAILSIMDTYEMSR